VKERDEVLTTAEACTYLRISRPTFLKLVRNNQIRARKVGKGWKVLRSELLRYMHVQETDRFGMVMVS
jgi:excisionase family DNA binding protein